MQKIDLLKSYHLNNDDEDELNFSGLYDLLVDYGIASTDTLDTILSINGTSVKVLLDVVFVKTGLRSIEQLITDIAQN